MLTFVPVLAKVWTWRMVTSSVPATPTSPPPTPATTAMIDSLPVAITETLPPAFTTAELSMNASVFSVRRRMPMPTPTPAPPAIAMDAATLSSWYWLPAATLTSPAESISADFPMYAEVLAVTTATAPERLTAASPAKPAAMPTAAMSSLFDAVTATPLSDVVVGVITRGPVSLASLDGVSPPRTMLCEVPVPVLVRLIAEPPFVADSCRCVEFVVCVALIA